jgi:ergothioneine biosynthesis protein EgtB
MAAGGYEKPELWLSEGWDAVRKHAWRAPLYWQEHDGGWHLFTLTGLRPVSNSEPVCHVSYFEADAFARWAQARLPTEQEWEVAAAPLPCEGNFVENGRWHPVPLVETQSERSIPADGRPPGNSSTPLRQVFGDVWEWSASPYTSYPGYHTPAGALGEYNAKFMCNQLVLRGGSCATPQDHIRSTYRNFFHPHARWQFTGIRLAKEV